MPAGHPEVWLGVGTGEVAANKDYYSGEGMGLAP